MILLLNFGLYLFNTHDTEEWKKIIEAFCPDIAEYRQFENDAGINSLTILALFGAYLGLALIMTWRNNIDKEGEKYDDLDNINQTNWTRFFLRLLMTLIIVAASMSLFLIISGKSSLALIIIFKVSLSFFLAGLSLFGLIIYLSIKFKLGNENFDIVEGGGYLAKLNQKDDVL